MSLKKDDEIPIKWVNTDSSEEKKPITPLLRSSSKDEKPEAWYEQRFPIIVAAKEWEVQRSRKSFLGHRTKKKKARVRIEIRRNSEQALGLQGYRDLEEGSAVSNWSDLVLEGDIIVFNTLTPDHGGRRSRITGSTIQSKSSHDDGSVSTMGFKAVDDTRERGGPLIKNWNVIYSMALSKATFKRNQSNCIDAILGNMRDESTESVTFNFASEDEAKSFMEFVRDMKGIQYEVAKTALKKSVSVGNDSPFESISFLIEIISATDLFPANRRTSDPYVVVRYGGEKVHKTSVISRDLDPVWTIKTKSMFIFTLQTEKYYESNLIFEIRDFETFHNNTNIGQAELSNERLVQCNGERIELKLQDLQKGIDKQGYLAIRCKKATQLEIDFLKSPKRKIEPARRNQTAFIQPLYSKQTPKFQLERKKYINGIKHYFVRPMSSDKTERWMTKTQIEETSREKSKYWIEAGSGDLGELFVEIISCDNLPNLDNGLPRNKTDAFASLVFEDAIVTTEVIRDTLNPRFMPWTRRAFKLNISHVTSPLFIGVFDHDIGETFDPVGRVSIPLQHFAPNTEYNLSYDLYDSAEIVKRKYRGKINIRLSVKWNGQRKLFFDGKNNPTSFIVNLENKHDYEFAKYAVVGNHDPKRYDIKMIFSLMHELMEYSSVFYTIVRGLKVVLLWRGHYRVNICCCQFYLPIHSMIMLSFGIVLTECPKYSLSVFFASIAWLMLGLLEYRTQRPLVWNRPPLYRNMWFRFLTGRHNPATIFPNQDEEEDRIFMEEREDRLESIKRITEVYLQRFNDDIGDLEEVKSKTLFKDSMGGLALFKHQLFPVQQQLYRGVFMLRFVEKIVTWDQLYISFWITTGAIFLSILTTFLWENTFLWFKRILFYGLLGPWIKIIDICYIQKLERMTEKEKLERARERKRRFRNRFSKGRIHAQLEKEDILKKAAMKEYMFGEHLLVVPNAFQPERYPSTPNIVSYANPSPDVSESLRQASKRSKVIGQQVSGAFVPANLQEHTMPHALGNLDSLNDSKHERSNLVEENGDGTYGAV